MIKKAFVFLLLCLTAVLSRRTPADGADVFWTQLGEPGVGGWITSVAVDPNDSNHLLIGGDLLSIGTSFDGGQSYNVSSGFTSCEIGDITFHPKNGKIVWAGTMSGPYVSMDGGLTWESRRNGLPEIAGYHYSAPIEKILFDPCNENRLLAFGGSSRRWGSPGKPAWGAVWESTDAGLSWSRLATIEPDDDAIFRQTGQQPDKWRGNIVSAAFAPGDSRTIYAAVHRAGLFRSDDSGKTWRPFNDGMPHLNVERVRVNAAEPNSVWISLNSGPAVLNESGQSRRLPGGTFKSTNRGKTWTNKSVGLDQNRNASPNLTSGYKTFDWSPSDASVLCCGDRAWNGDYLYRSVDGGETWKKVLHRSVKGVCNLSCAYFSGAGGTVMTIDPSNAKIAYAAGAEFVVQTKDGGESWQDVSATKIADSPENRTWSGRGYSGLCACNFRFDPYHRERSVLMAMDAGKCWESANAFQTWTFRGSADSPWGGGNDASFAKEGTVYVTTGQGGNTGTVLRGALNAKGFWVNVRNIADLKVDQTGLPPAAECVATGIYTLPDDAARVWAVLAHKLFYSSDSGAHWSVLFDQEPVEWLAADPRAPLTIYVSGKTNVWKTTDGRRFTAIGGPEVAGRMAVDRKGRLLITAYRGKNNPGLWRYDPTAVAEKQDNLGELDNSKRTDDLNGAVNTAWTCLKKDEYLCNVAVDPTDENRILTCGNDDPYHDAVRSNIWISSDGGANWEEASSGLPVRRATAVAFNPWNPEQIIVGTGGCGFFKAVFRKEQK